MKINNVILAESSELPPIGEVMYQYVVARNGLFIRAEDSRLEACVIIAPAQLNGLAQVEEYAKLKIERVSDRWLWSVLASARKRMPNEAMYQFLFDEMRVWRCVAPKQTASPTAVDFSDDGQSVIDLHSHNSMPSFFSATDDGDEGGMRFYAVIGRIDTDQPEIRVRVGVYGHHWAVPAETIFDGLGPFVDRLGEDDDDEPPRTCRVCGCTDEHGCETGCFWVEDDLCSNCGDVPVAKLSDAQRDLIEAWHDRLV